MAEGEIAGGGKSFSLVTVLLLNYVDVYIWSEHMRRHSIQSEHIHIHRPYVHYFRSFVFSLSFFNQAFSRAILIGIKYNYVGQ